MIHFTVSGSVAKVLLDRAPVNAIDHRWLAEFHSILDHIEAQSELNVIHIRSGQKVFCAGMDMDRVRALHNMPNGADVLVEDVGEFQRLFARLEASASVVVCELSGAAIGGGLELALACDLRIAADKAKMGLPEASLGLIPGAGGTQRLTMLCGRGLAGRLILTGELITGSEAFALGLVQWTAPSEELEVRTEAIVQRITKLSPPALREAKRLIAAAGDLNRDGYAEEREADRRLFANNETKKRVTNFLAGAR